MELIVEFDLDPENCETGSSHVVIVVPHVRHIHVEKDHYRKGETRLEINENGYIFSTEKADAIYKEIMMNLFAYYNQIQSQMDDLDSEE